MKCFVCDNKVIHGILLSADGDFACSQKCKEKHEQDREHFLNVVIHDDQLYEAWLKE